MFVLIPTAAYIALQTFAPPVVLTLTLFVILHVGYDIWCMDDNIK